MHHKSVFQCCKAPMLTAGTFQDVELLILNTHKDKKLVITASDLHCHHATCPRTFSHLLYTCTEIHQF